VLERAAERIERELFDLCEPEVLWSEIGERVMRELQAIDSVAYVRFASVYRAVQSVSEFEEIVERASPQEVTG
jgi:transcriptional repressor NrdR